MNQLFYAALVAVVMTHAVQGDEDQECNPCRLLDRDDMEIFLDSCEDNPIIQAIRDKDSSCGSEWDAFCLVTYNDCYNN